MHTYIWLGKHL